MRDLFPICRVPCITCFVSLTLCSPAMARWLSRSRTSTDWTRPLLSSRTSNPYISKRFCGQQLDFLQVGSSSTSGIRQSVIAEGARCSPLPRSVLVLAPPTEHTLLQEELAGYQDLGSTVRVLDLVSLPFQLEPSHRASSLYMYAQVSGKLSIRCIIGSV